MATPPRRPNRSRPGDSGYGDALANEAIRQARIRFFRRVPFLYEFSNIYYRLQSGSYLHPRYVISAVIGLFVVGGGAIVSCIGAIGAILASLSGQ